MATKTVITTAALAAILGLAACAETSAPMLTEDGSYIITGTAKKTARAVNAAQDKAQSFCAEQGRSAVAVASRHQAGQSESFLFAGRGGVFGGSDANYDTDLQFRCVVRSAPQLIVDRQKPLLPCEKSRRRLGHMAGHE
jgi:hypothetical protein